MLLSDFMVGLEFFAVICTLIFIISLLLDAPFLASLIGAFKALTSSNAELVGDLELYCASNMKQSLLNQHVAPRI